MSKLFTAMRNALFSDDYKEFLLYTGSIAFYWILISYTLGFNWHSQVKSMIDCFKMMCVFAYIKSCENSYKIISKE